MQKRLLGIALILALTVSLGALSDEITLKDGSRLIGTIIKLRDGNLILQTEHLGKVTIDSSGIEGIQTNQINGIAMNDLSPHLGTLKYSEGQQQVILERGDARPLALTDLSLIWPADKEMPKPEKLWHAQIDLGINGASGNSDRFSFLGRSEVTRKTDINKLLLYLQGYYAEDNGIRSHNEFKTGARYEWKADQRWSAYTRLEFEEDEFEALDLRSTLVFGASYKVLQKPKQTLNTRLGVGYQREDFEIAPSEDKAILDFGYDYMLKIRNWAKLTHDLTYYAGLESPTEEFRIVMNTGAEVPLTASQNWKLKVGVKHEYDDEPLPTVEDLDTIYYLNLGYGW